MFAKLRRNVDVIFDRDPAARNLLEVMLNYPGLHALFFHEIAHRLYRVKLFTLARLVSQVSRFLTGIEIHPGAVIGEGLFIDHGMGVVIGETSRVGDNVTMYQGVTLGGTGKEKGKRHPTIGDHVVIGAGAKVLGSFRVGDNVKIGAGAVVLREVPDNATVVGVPGRIIIQDGKRRDLIDLEHHQLPDPVEQIVRDLEGEIMGLREELEAMRRKNEEYEREGVYSH